MFLKTESHTAQYSFQFHQLCSKVILAGSSMEAAFAWALT